MRFVGGGGGTAQPWHTNYWAPRTRKRHQQEHRPQRPTESSNPTQHAKGRTGDCPGPVKEQQPDGMLHRGGGVRKILDPIPPLDDLARPLQRPAVARRGVHQILDSLPLSIIRRVTCEGLLWGVGEVRRIPDHLPILKDLARSACSPRCRPLKALPLSLS